MPITTSTALPCRVSLGSQHQPQHGQYRSNREMPANQYELRRLADRRHERNLVELMGDGVEGRCDPAVPNIEPSAGRRHGCRQQGKEEPATVRSLRHPIGPWAHGETLCDRIDLKIMVSPP